MVIGLDYDGTFTRDPDAWRNFLRDFSDRGHRVVVVTCRNRLEMDDVAEATGLSRGMIYCTDRAAKHQWLKEHYPDLTIDIWIDNDPRTIFEGI